MNLYKYVFKKLNVYINNKRCESIDDISGCFFLNLAGFGVRINNQIGLFWRIRGNLKSFNRKCQAIYNYTQNQMMLQININEGSHSYKDEVLYVNKDDIINLYDTLNELNKDLKNVFKKRPKENELILIEKEFGIKSIFTELYEMINVIINAISNMSINQECNYVMEQLKNIDEQRKVSNRTEMKIELCITHLLTKSEFLADIEYNREKDENNLFKDLESLTTETDIFREEDICHIMNF